METTQEILNLLVQNLTEQYSTELQKFPIKKQLREALIDGFRAGARQATFHTATMLGATINK